MKFTVLRRASSQIARLEQIHLLQKRENQEKAEGNNYCSERRQDEHRVCFWLNHSSSNQSVSLLFRKKYSTMKLFLLFLLMTFYFCFMKHSLKQHNKSLAWEARKIKSTVDCD